jgi:hypothetical protein
MTFLGLYTYIFPDICRSLLLMAKVDYRPSDPLAIHLRIFGVLTP